MKKLLLTAALAVAAFSSHAQDCAAYIATTGNVKTQVQKAACASADKQATATVWLSRDNDGLYLHISNVTSNNKLFNLKAQPGDRLQLTYVDGNAMSSQLMKKTGNEVIVTLSQDMVNAILVMQLENIAWFENNAMQPSLQLVVDNSASQKLVKAASCLQ